MSTQNDPSGVNDPAASGAGDPEKKKDVVQYDTHLKVLNEKKLQQERAAKLEEELKALKQEKEAKEKEELEQQGNWKKLLEQERERAKELESKHNSLLGSIQEARKRSAVLRFVNGTVPEEVVGTLLSVEGVALNEDGTVNEDTAKVVAQEFERKFPYVVLRNNKNGTLPSDAAHTGAGTKLTYQEWLKLPAKEMNKRYGEVDWTTA